MEVEGRSGRGHPAGKHSGQDFQLWSQTAGAASSGSLTCKLVDLGNMITLSLRFPVCDMETQTPLILMTK